MFTGIIEELGSVRALDSHRLVIACDTVTDDSGVGASVAVNGVCLTVVEWARDALTFDLSEETIARTSLRRLATGAPVNLERPISLAARLGGHLVQGHVDGVGEVMAIVPDAAGGARVRVSVPSELRLFLIEKGSVTIDGVSLTVAELHSDAVTTALIPHTLAVTTLGTALPGDPVNLEVDMIARYVERLLVRAPDMRTHEHDQADHEGADR